MLQTVEAIIDPTGAVRLLGNVAVTTPQRAIVIVLDTADYGEPVTKPGLSATLLQFRADHPLPPECKRSEEAIDAHIQAERDAWD